MRPDVPLRSGAAFGLFDGLLDEYDAEFGLTTSVEHRRARALATVLRRVRPHLDLYLLTDEAVPDAADPTVLAFDRAFYRYESRSELHMTLLDGVRRRLSTPFFDALKSLRGPPDRQLPRPADRPWQLGLQLPVAAGHGRVLRPQHLHGRDVDDLRWAGLAADPHGILKKAQDKAAKTSASDAHLLRHQRDVDVEQDRRAGADQARRHRPDRPQLPQVAPLRADARRRAPGLPRRLHAARVRHVRRGAAAHDQEGAARPAAALASWTRCGCCC